MSAKKTPLYDHHIKAGGNVVDYAGWMLPVEYEGLIPEHEAVRNAAGLFDVSHMGEVTVQGPDAQKFLNYLFTNDLTKSEDFGITYGMFCYEDGGVVDDLLIYRKGENDYYLVPNASNTAKDYEWMLEHAKDFDVQIKNISDSVGEIAIQGPNAQKILQKLTETDLAGIGYYKFDDQVMVAGKPTMVSRTGYTGEDGFEVYASREDIGEIWDALLEVGEEDGLKPTGLGCRDTLRFEAGMPLYGNEMTEEINPLQAGLKYFVKLDKEADFVGKEALSKQWADGLKQKIVGLELTGKGIPRHGYEVLKDDKVIGHITTGYMPPTVGKPIANALIDIDQTELGNEVEVQIRKRRVPAKVISRKFLEKK
ncbi:MAG: glycine cleavage system aminomethyltransferase GcvT [Tissierellia bacterium]|jgi:aminomethyltransferase|nr:glycine cleavage system aminomethyltransferase GcvT [Bacillota bacterium]NLK58208.1 glycine cleavage system aminomethyltransferase GcvT [Tissierellia bacterium]